MRKLIDTREIEKVIEEMEKVSKTCHRAAQEHPQLAGLYSAQAMASEGCIIYLRDIVLKKHTTTLEP